ncbi:MAG: SDR family NAD(P)-dependent oxidoreductase [Pseudomonadales bacterium]
MQLTGKKIVITGGSGVLAQAVADQTRLSGAAPVLLDIVFSDAVKSNFDSDDLKLVDLTDLAATTECFAEIGHADAVFNLAGGFAMGGMVHDITDDDWDFMFKINVTTMRNTIKAAVPAMQANGSGSIVNVGAFGAQHGQAAMSAYIASKSVVMRLTESLSEELKTQGINVNAVLPTVIDTPRNRADMPDADPSQWVNPKDLANVICFLGSDAAKAVHGALVPVTGLS